VEPKDCRISWVCPLFQGPSLCRVSGVELAWSGVTVERHLVGAGEHTGADLNRHFIVPWDVHPYRGERSELCGRRFAPYGKNPGVLSLVPSGVHPAHRGTSQTLDPVFVKRTSFGLKI